MPLITAAELCRGHLIREGSEWLRVTLTPQVVGHGDILAYTSGGYIRRRSDDLVIVASREPRL